MTGGRKYSKWTDETLMCAFYSEGWWSCEIAEIGECEFGGYGCNKCGVWEPK
jgi:hypothetical protein